MASFGVIIASIVVILAIFSAYTFFQSYLSFSPKVVLQEECEAGNATWLNDECRCGANFSCPDGFYCQRARRTNEADLCKPVVSTTCFNPSDCPAHPCSIAECNLGTCSYSFVGC